MIARKNRAVSGGLGDHRGDVEAKDNTAYFEMSFCPNVELVSVVRRFISSVYDRLFDDADAAARVALAAHELLENAVRYASDNVTGLRIELASGGAQSVVTITTKNRASEEDAVKTQGLIREIAGEPDPFRLYQAKMRATAGSKEGSGLGLARVRAEADMTLRCDREGDLITVTARAELPAEAAHV